MSPKREAGSNARTRRRVREMTSKRLSRMVILTGLLLVLTACTSPAPASTPTASAPPPTSAGTVVPTPSPTELRLDPVPQYCPVSNPTPHMSLPGLGPVIGASPVWADWPPGGPVIAHLSHAPPGVYEAPYGWAILKTIWEVGPNYTHPVTVRGHDLFDHHTPPLTLSRMMLDKGGQSP